MGLLLQELTITEHPENIVVGSHQLERTVDVTGLEQSVDLRGRIGLDGLDCIEVSEFKGTLPILDLDFDMKLHSGIGGWNHVGPIGQADDDLLRSVVDGLGHVRVCRRPG